MDHIQNAVRLAKSASVPGKEPKPKAESDRQKLRPETFVPNTSKRSLLPSSVAERRWTPSAVMLDPEHLKSHRVVSSSAQSADHVAFNVLRTRLYQVLTGNAWHSLSVTSPTTGCGKTMVAVNLAFSLARQTGCRTALIDLDLRKASVARTLGVKPQASIGEFLEGKESLEDCFVAVGDNLFFGLNDHRLNRTFELAQHQRTAEIIPAIMKGLEPQVLIVDLPPMLSSDEVMAFQPHVDACFLVAAAGQTTAKEIEECEAEFREEDAFLGVVLNKCAEVTEEYYQYQPI